MSATDDPVSRITVQRRITAAGLPAPSTLRAWALAALGTAHAELTLRIVDEAESADLNGRFRGKPYPTNVLSFPYEAEAVDDRLAGAVLGDIVVCAPVVAREAAAQGKDARAHWAHMIVHGVLHLLGHDHIDDAEAQIMETREREILARLGFPDPY